MIIIIFSIISKLNLENLRFSKFSFHNLFTIYLSLLFISLYYLSLFTLYLSLLFISLYYLSLFTIYLSLPFISLYYLSLIILSLNNYIFLVFLIFLIFFSQSYDKLLKEDTIRNKKMTINCKYETESRYSV